MKEEVRPNASQKYLKFMNYLKSTKDSIYPEIFLASLFCRASRDLLEYSSPEMLDSLSQTFGEEDSNVRKLTQLGLFD